MSGNETHASILAEARDKYTVHECNECVWRKSCEEKFKSEKCDEFRESIMLKLGIDDGYFVDLLRRLEEAHERETVTNRNQLGNCAAMREAINKALAFLETAFETKDGRLHFSDIVRIGNAKSVLKAALSAPARNCDLPNTTERYNEFCYAHRTMETCCYGCPYEEDSDCEAQWLLAPAEKGGKA